MRSILYIVLINFLVFYSKHSLSQENNNDFESLKNITKQTIHKSGDYFIETENSFKIMTNKGRTDLSFVKLQYDPDEENLELLSAYTSTNGVLKIVNKKLIKNSRVHLKDGGISNLNELMIPFDNLSVGTIVSYKIKSTHKNKYVAGRIGHIFGFSSKHIANEEEYSIVSDLELKLGDISINKDFDLASEQRLGKYIYKFTPSKDARNLKEKFGKSYLHVLTNYKTWNEVRDFLTAKYEKAISEKLPKELENIITEAKLISDLNSQIEFVSDKLFSQITYSGKWTNTKEKMFPKGHVSVLKTKTGDCKDFATATAAILQKLGFEAHVALTHRGSPENLEIRSPKFMDYPNFHMFNHAIVWSRDKNGVVRWIDPTNSAIGADHLQPDILGSPALVLSNTSNSLMYLPNENKQKEEVNIKRTVTLRQDETAIYEGTFEFDKYSAIPLQNAIKEYGQEHIKPSLSKFVYPETARKFEFSTKTTPTKATEIQFNLHAISPIVEKLNQYSYVYVPSPAIYPINRLSLATQKVAYLGEPGTLNSVTVLPISKVDDLVSPECIAITPWYDIFRKVEIKENKLIVTDKLVTKTRFLKLDDLQNEDNRIYLSKIFLCAREDKILISKNDKTLTLDDIEKNKNKGKPLEALSVDEAISEFRTSNVSMMNYMHAKERKYFGARLEKNKNDTLAIAKIAYSTKAEGFIKTDTYLPAYIEHAERMLLEGLQINNNCPELNTELAYISILKKNYVDASKYISKVYAVENMSARTAIMYAELDVKQNRIQDAISRLQSIDLTTAKHWQVRTILSNLASIYTSTKNFEKAIEMYNQIIQKDPKNAWNYHNFALVYFDMNNYDKVIELEQKALSVTEFGMAKRTLSEVYRAKAQSNYINRDMRSIASFTTEKIQQTEDFYLQSIKWDSENLAALKEYANFLLNLYNNTRDIKYKNNAVSYIERALKLFPDDANLRKMLTIVNN